MVVGEMVEMVMQVIIQEEVVLVVEIVVVLP
jgi:hypothetical protein